MNDFLPLAEQCKENRISINFHVSIAGNIKITLLALNDGNISSSKRWIEFEVLKEYSHSDLTEIIQEMLNELEEKNDTDRNSEN